MTHDWFGCSLEGSDDLTCRLKDIKEYGIHTGGQYIIGFAHRISKSKAKLNTLGIDT